MNIEISIEKAVWARFISGGALAVTEVSKARRRGELKDACHFLCVDCGNQAAVYDHRDYNLPLLIEPVCRRCNMMRGHAKPKKWAKGELAEYARLMRKRATSSPCSYKAKFYEMVGIK